MYSCETKLWQGACFLFTFKNLYFSFPFRITTSFLYSSQRRCRNTSSGVFEPYIGFLSFKWIANLLILVKALSVDDSAELQFRGAAHQTDPLWPLPWDHTQGRGLRSLEWPHQPLHDHTWSPMPVCRYSSFVVCVFVDVLFGLYPEYLKS